MATVRQRKAMKILIEKDKNNEPIIMKDVMMKAGYPETTASRPQDLTTSKGWLKLKEKYLNDEKALITLDQLADASNDDKDNRLKSSIEILKLNDRYPALKNKVVGLFQTLDGIEE